MVGFDLTAGTYALKIDGLAGYGWGNPFNYAVAAGKPAYPLKIGP